MTASDVDALEMNDANEFTNLTECSNHEGKGTTHEQDCFEPDTLFFEDGIRRIDFVLAYESQEAEGEHSAEYKRRVKRTMFEKNLMETGLELEIEPPKKSLHGRTSFVKMHAPWDVLTRMAEMLRIKMPIKKNDLKKSKLRSWVDSLLSRYNPFLLEGCYHTEEASYFTAAFNREQEHQFLINDRNSFFKPSQRARMVYDILSRTRYDPQRRDRIGIERLISNYTYSAAYPLHEGDYVSENQNASSGAPLKNQKPRNDRELLYETWARPKRWFKYQPLHLIRRYYGEKIALYFGWIGFYTEMLIPAAFAGIICIIYGAVTLKNDIPSSDVCNVNGAGDVTMCPLCDKLCPYWKLNLSCLISRFTYVFDNVATVIFAIFMSVWATLFIEFWKRRQSMLQWDWDLMDYELQEEQVRPEFRTKVKTKKINTINQEHEPYLPLHEEFLRISLSSVTVLFFLLLMLTFVLGIIVYRIIVVHLLFMTGEPMVQSYAKITTSITAGLVHLVVIIFLGRIYQTLAWYLTDMERPRTRTQFENSFTFKVFLFQFINYYSSLFYIAFIKGKLSTSLAAKSKELLFEKYRFEECDVAGCMPELFIHLSVIMVGKQLLNNFMAILFPICLNWFRNLRVWLKHDARKSHTRWEKDYHLNEVPDMMLFYEYLEIAIQYGFVTLFVAAFPLAPFFAFLNNIMELRLDAYKFVTTYRRPTPYRARDIGIWFRILDGMSWVAVVFNSLIIAFTSDFVPRLLYQMVYSCTPGSLEGYVDHSLSFFNVSDFSNFSRPHQKFEDDEFQNVEICRYRDSRNPPCPYGNASLYMSPSCNHHYQRPTGVECETAKYRFTIEWWHILAARLAFVIVFEHLVFMIKGIVSYLIPDVPHDIYVKVQREIMLAKQARFNLMIEQRRRATKNWPTLDTLVTALPRNSRKSSTIGESPDERDAVETAAIVPMTRTNQRSPSPHGSTTTKSEAERVLDGFEKVLAQDYGALGRDKDLDDDSVISSVDESEPEVVVDDLKGTPNLCDPDLTQPVLDRRSAEPEGTEFSRASVVKKFDEKADKRGSVISFVTANELAL